MGVGTQDGKRAEVPVEEPEDDPENWVQVIRDGTPEYYTPYTATPDNSRGNHILRGSCDATIEDEDGNEHRCGNDAAVRRLSSGGVEEYCLVPGHAPDSWRSALDGTGHLDDTLIDLRQECCKSVVNHNRDGKGQLDEDHDGGDRARIKRPPAVSECGDRAFIMLTDGDRYAKSFCRQHARRPWYNNLRLWTGDPTEPDTEWPGNTDRGGWPDDVDRDGCVWVDAPTGEGFQSHAAWSDAVSGRYPDVMAAERHLVVLRDAGETVVRSGSASDRY